MGASSSRSAGPPDQGYRTVHLVRIDFLSFFRDWQRGGPSQGSDAADDTEICRVDLM
jgi:hypothetical protein